MGKSDMAKCTPLQYTFPEYFTPMLLGLTGYQAKSNNAAILTKDDRSQIKVKACLF